MKLAFALSFALALSATGAAHSQQLKALPVKSYVLTDPDGTPRYLVRYSEDSNVRKVYYVKPVEPQNSNPPQRREANRRNAPAKRFIWPNEWM